MTTRSTTRAVTRSTTRGITSSKSGGPSVPPALFELQSSGSLFVPAMDSLDDWDTVEAPWNAVAKDTFLSSGKIDRTAGDALYTDGRRNPYLLVDDDGTLYLIFISYPVVSGQSLNFIVRSTDMGRTWVQMGQMSELNAKIGGGTWAGCACPGELVKWGSTYYFHRGLSDTLGSFPPYSWDVWSASDLDNESGGKYGDWASVRAQSPGSTWAGTDLIPGSTILHEGTYYHFAQAYAGSWVIGIMSASAPEGPWTQIGSTPVLSITETDPRVPENARVFFHAGIGKFVMLVNLIAVSGTFTDANGVFVGTDDPTDWTGATFETIQTVTPIHGDNAIGMLVHVPESGNSLIYDAVTNDFDIVYDTDATGDSPGWHSGRRIVPATLRYSAGEYPFAGAGLTYLKKTLAHTDITMEAQVKFNAASGNSMGFMFRMTGGAGYVLACPDNADVVLLNASFGLISNGSGGAAPVLGAWNHVKLVCVGTSIKIWLNGELQFDISDATYASGTDFWVYQANVTGAVRDIRITTSDSATFTGLEPKQVVFLRGASGLCVGEVVADGDGEATAVLSGSIAGLQIANTVQAIQVTPGSSYESSGSIGLPTISAVSGAGDLPGTDLSVTASNAASYQWQIKDGLVWRNVAGLDSALEFAPELWGRFRCLVSNSAGCVATDEFETSMADTADLYLDSDRGMYTERTGPSATTVTTDGNPVGTWRDTVHGHNFVASSDGVRPTLTGEYIALSADYLEDATVDVLAAKSAFTVIVECSKEGGFNHILLHQAGTLGIQWFYGEWIFYVGTGEARWADIQTRHQVIKIVFDGTQTGDANRLKVYFDDDLKTLTFPVAIPSSTANTPGLAIGDVYGSPGAAPWAGSIKRVIITGAEDYP